MTKENQKSPLGCDFDPTKENEEMTLEQFKQCYIYSENQNEQTYLIEKNYGFDGSLKEIKKYRNIKEYSTKDFIKDLIENLSMFPNQLKLIFPERINYRNKGLSDAKIGRFWGKAHNYLRRHNRKYNDNHFHRIPNEALEDLINTFDSLDSFQRAINRAIGVNKYDHSIIFFEIKSNCIDNIDKYIKKRIDLTQFTEMLRSELYKISGMVYITNEELSQLFGNSSSYINYILNLIKLKPNRSYDTNVDYKIDLQTLSVFYNNISVIFKENAIKCLKLIEKYIRINTDLRSFPTERCTIRNKTYFDDALYILNGDWDLINSTEEELLEIFYWLGFFVADVYINLKANVISFSLQIRDEKSVYRLADMVGVDHDRVYTNIHYREKDGVIKPFPQKVVGFGSKYMIQVLDKLDLIGFKEGKIGLPSVIKKLILDACRKTHIISNVYNEFETYEKEIIKKRIEDNAYTLLKTIEGKLALTFLRGFYDGDGHWQGTLTTTLTNSNKKLLIDIKDFYFSPNLVRPHKSNSVILTLGSKLTDAMFQAYDKGLIRKSPNSSRN